METKLKLKGRQVYIVSYKRTPLGIYRSKLASFTGVELGAIAVRAALENAKIDKNTIDYVIMGNCCQSGQGQNPAR